MVPSSPPMALSSHHRRYHIRELDPRRKYTDAQLAAAQLQLSALQVGMDAGHPGRKGTNGGLGGHLGQGSGMIERKSVVSIDEGDDGSVGSDISGSVGPLTDGGGAELGLEGHTIHSPGSYNKGADHGHSDDIDDEATINTTQSNDSGEGGLGLDGAPLPGSGPASITSVSISRKSRGGDSGAGGPLEGLEPSLSLELESPLKTMRVQGGSVGSVGSRGSKGSRGRRGEK